ncbi:MAG: hypothetical protein HOE61_08230 [Candidatus Marinimicrobia bacterium]|jgi:hypothetical protein|nr:hypothetical protein [Candidatus Neomarinimicrobiota bacterium]
MRLYPYVPALALIFFTFTPAKVSLAANDDDGAILIQYCSMFAPMSQGTIFSFKSGNPKSKAISDIPKMGVTDERVKLMIINLTNYVYDLDPDLTITSIEKKLWSSCLNKTLYTELYDDFLKETAQSRQR